MNKSYKLLPLLHSNCDLFYPCTKYTQLKYMMQPVEGS